MTVDREQIRRDADVALWHAGRDKSTFVQPAETLAEHCLALLAELEQAEKERLQLLGRIGGINTERGKLEARLAKVPALVEAIRQCVGQEEDGTYFVPHDPEGDAIREHLIPALAEWERE